MTMIPKFVTLVRDSDDALIIVNISNILLVTQDPEDPKTCIVYLAEPSKTTAVRVRHNIKQISDCLDT